MIEKITTARRIPRGPRTISIRFTLRDVSQGVDWVRRKSVASVRRVPHMRIRQ